MFTKKKNTSTITKGSRELLKEQVLNLQVAQDQLLFKLQSRKTYDTDSDGWPPVDFKQSSSIQYIEGVYVEDLTTDEQTHLGISIFYAKVTKTTSSSLHKHHERHQIVNVKKGRVTNKADKKEYLKGDTFCISKNENHALTYYTGSELLFISIPGLPIIEKTQN